MNWDDTPGTLDAELFKESGCDHSVRGSVGVWIEKGAAEDTHADDAEPTAKDLATVPDRCAPGDSAQVCHDLGHCYRIGRKQILILQHGRIQVLTTMGHEVEAGHQQNEVDENEPMLFQGNLALCDESTRDIALPFSNRDSPAERLSLGQAESENYDQDRWSSSEPVSPRSISVMELVENVLTHQKSGRQP